VARAKRTDRAEARRRYRATFADPAEGDLIPEDGDTVESAADAGSSGGRRAAGSASAVRAGGTAPSPTTAPPARPSLGAAFRSSFRPVDLRGDLRALPQLVRHWSFFVPVILSGLSVALIPLLGLNALTSAFFQYFSFTAPLGTSFLAGFFAPRASYLVGMLAALASVGFQVLAYSVGPFGGLFNEFRDANNAILGEAAAKQLVINQALTVGVPSAALFAAAAAWYRRFLNRANPNRGRARAQAAGGRRPDGKVPKKNQQRPALARRR
jgi:drug/metabolite transporter (DMT)-like permease